MAKNLLEAKMEADEYFRKKYQEILAKSHLTKEQIREHQQYLEEDERKNLEEDELKEAEIKMKQPKTTPEEETSSKTSD